MILGMRTRQFVGKRVAVIGMRRTGRATAAVLQRLGAHVVLSDAAPAEALGADYEAARALPVEVKAGAQPDAALGDAELVVPSPGVPWNAEVLQVAVRAGIPVLSEIEIAYRIALSPILAVTGTNGKSTTAAWLHRMMEEAGYTAYLAGNIAADDIKCTLIDAAERAQENDVIVAEISSFQLEWVESFRPRVGILTNVRRDHLDRYGSLDTYARCKARLFSAQRPGDVAVINAVNAPARRIASQLTSRVVWFDRGYCGGEDWACIREQQLTVRFKGDEFALVRADELLLPGRHNQENALAAAAAAIAFGAEPEPIRRALRTFEGLPHRMELVAEFGGVCFINASMTTNVDAAVRVLESVGRPVVLIAGGRLKNEDYAPLGRAMARHVVHAVLIGEGAATIEESAHAAGFYDIARAGDMEEAVVRAARRARPGDAVVLAPACSSHDMFRDFEARGQAFRDVVHKLRQDAFGAEETRL